MTATFNLALKSTLDKAIKAIADASQLDFVDLDGTPLSSERLLQAKNAIAWAYSGLSSTVGGRVFFSLVFEVGAVTASTTGTYTSTDIAGTLLDVFRPYTQIDIYDYSGAQAGTSRLGDLSVVSADMQPLQSNEVEGFRAVTVVAKGARYSG
jgi:hypothetical protein